MHVSTHTCRLRHRVAERKCEHTRGATARGCLHPNTTAVFVDDALADRKAEAGPALVTRVAGVDLMEAHEDVLGPLGGHAAATVDDAYRDHVASIVVEMTVDADS